MAHRSNKQTPSITEAYIACAKQASAKHLKLSAGPVLWWRATYTGLYLQAQTAFLETGHQSKNVFAQGVRHTNIVTNASYEPIVLTIRQAPAGWAAAQRIATLPGRGCALTGKTLRVSLLIDRNPCQFLWSLCAEKQGLPAAPPWNMQGQLLRANDTDTALPFPFCLVDT